VEVFNYKIKNISVQRRICWKEAVYFDGDTGEGRHRVYVEE